MTIPVPVPPSSVAVTVRTVLGEQAEAQQVDDQAQRAHHQDQLGIVDGLRLVEPLETLHGDGETEGHQEHGVD